MGMVNDHVLPVLARAWANRLQREIDLLRAGLPEMPRLTDRHYVGPQSLLGPSWPSEKANTKYWEEVPGDYAILAGLVDLQFELEQAITDLAPDWEAAKGESDAS